MGSYKFCIQCQYLGAQKVFDLVLQEFEEGKTISNRNDLEKLIKDFDNFFEGLSIHTLVVMQEDNQQWTQLIKKVK